MANKKNKVKDIVSKDIPLTREEKEQDFYTKVVNLVSKNASVIDISKELDITVNSALYWINKVNNGGKASLVDEIRKALDADSYETYDLAKRYTRTPAAITRLVKKAELEYSPVADWIKKASKTGIKLSRLKKELGIKTVERAKEVLKENFKDCFIVATPIGNEDFILTPVYSSKEDVEWLNIDTTTRKFDYYVAPEGNYLCINFHDDIPKDKITIVQLSDIHVGSLYFRKAHFQDFVNRVKKDPYCFVFLTGDVIECISKATAGGSWVQYDNINNQVEEFFHIIKPIADRIICSIEGNHEARVERLSEFSLSRTIANILKVPYFNVLTYIDLIFKDQKFTIGATHYYAKNLFGQAAIVARVKQISGGLLSPCNLWLSGHTHSGWIQTEYATSIFTGKGREPFEYHIANSGSFTQHTGSYSEKAGYQWSPQSVIYFTIDNSGKLEVFQNRIKPL